MLFHISERGDIAQFEPRAAEPGGERLVWAIDDARLRNYLLPRDCPRVTYCAGPGTSTDDITRYLGASAAVIAIESEWHERARNTPLFCYQMPAAPFSCIDEGAGYHVSRVPVAPISVTSIADPVGELLKQGVELRLVPTLWPLHDMVVASTLQFSMIRMRNARTREWLNEQTIRTAGATACTADRATRHDCADDP